VFLLPDQANGVVFQVTDDGIVRIDYQALSSIEDILKASEVVLGPIPPNQIAPSLLFEPASFAA